GSWQRHTTDFPSASRPMARPSMLPSPSPSGLRWHARETRLALRSASAASRYTGLSAIVYLPVRILIDFVFRFVLFQAVLVRLVVGLTRDGLGFVRQAGFLEQGENAAAGLGGLILKEGQFRNGPQPGAPAELG